jgi:hypothetical protein
MQVSRGRSSLRKESAFSFAFEEKRCLGLSTRAPYANYDDDAKKEKKKKVRHPSFGPGDAPGPCSTPTRRRDTGSPRGPPPRSRAAGTPAIPCTSRRSRRRLFPRGSPRAGARVEASSPRRLSERTKMARVCRLRGDATPDVRGRAPTLTLPRPDTVATSREVSTAARSRSLGGRLLRRASSSSSRRARLGSVVGRFGSAKRVPGRYPPISARGIRARSSLYGLRSQIASERESNRGLPPGSRPLAKQTDSRLGSFSVFFFGRLAEFPHTRASKNRALAPAAFFA